MKRVAAVLLVLLLTFASLCGANACDIDGKATAVANGARAVPSHVTFTLKTARTWALFAFPGHYHARTPIHFTEDRGQLRHALPSDSLRHTLRRDFGDGTHATGWAVAHRYAHAGIYRITVNASYSTWHQYFPFDNVRISVPARIKAGHSAR